jgi:hypothetical protein
MINILDSVTGRAYLPVAVAGIFVRDELFNTDDEHMGSTTFGTVTPATMTGPTMPQNDNRAGSGRVRPDGGA